MRKLPILGVFLWALNSFTSPAYSLDLETLLPADVRLTLSVIADPSPDDGRYIFLFADNSCLERFEDLLRAGKPGERSRARAVDIANQIVNGIKSVGEFNARGVRIPRYDEANTVRQIYSELGQGYFDVETATYMHYSETLITHYSENGFDLCVEEAVIH